MPEKNVISKDTWFNGNSLSLEISHGSLVTLMRYSSGSFNLTIFDITPDDLKYLISICQSRLAEIEPPSATDDRDCRWCTHLKNPIPFDPNDGLHCEFKRPDVPCKDYEESRINVKVVQL